MGVTAGTVQAGAKSVQRGLIDAPQTSQPNGTAIVRVFDVTIAAVDMNKARVTVNVLVGYDAASQAAATIAARMVNLTNTTSDVLKMGFGYLLNSTTLRIYTGGAMGAQFAAFNGVWQVVEDY